ncbi:MAG: hypothetical protein BIFFINMI_01113 [Phycisphaerae bacterium]|nr:hypothetical protein [Phycisphaerae bacterium]
MRRTTRFALLAVMIVAGVLLATSSVWAQGGAPKPEKVTWLQHFFVRGGWVVWFLELPMSVAMVALSVMYFLEFRRSSLISDETMEQIRSLLEARQYREAIEYSANDPTMISSVVHAALAEASNGYPAMERAMEEAIDGWSSNSLRRIEFLNLIGNIAPMVGLFGTVVGMILTFNKIVEVGGVPNAAELADGISVALVTTFWGLIIAIPALSVFAAIRNRIEALSAEAALRAQSLLGMFNPAAPKTPAAAPPAAAPKPVTAPKPAPTA